MNDNQMKETESTIASVASDIRTAAGEKFDQAVTEVRAKADGAKSDVAGEVKDIATALRRASEELRDGSAQERTLGKMASGLADVSDTIRDKDLGEIMQMASRVARDNPVLFLSGAALLGFVASRYAKASSGHANTSAGQYGAGNKSQVAVYTGEGDPSTQTARVSK